MWSSNLQFLQLMSYKMVQIEKENQRTKHKNNTKHKFFSIQNFFKTTCLPTHTAVKTIQTKDKWNNGNATYPKSLHQSLHPQSLTKYDGSQTYIWSDPCLDVTCLSNRITSHQKLKYENMYSRITSHGLLRSLSSRANTL